MTKNDILNSELNIINKEEETLIETGLDRYVAVGEFLDMFSEVDLNHTELRTHENATDRWAQIFDNWKEEGLI